MPPLPKIAPLPPRSALDYAMEYIDRGWPVFPCRSADEEEADHQTGEVRVRFTVKSPLTSTGFRAASTSERTVSGWFRLHPEAMIGIPTGEAIGAFVIDIDVKGDVNGFDWLRQVQAEHGRLPDTLTANTASGGQHLYFRHVEGVRNRGRLGPGVDVRGDGGYVVAPGSVMADGRRYVWIDPDEEIAEAPQWLLDLVVRRDAPAQPTAYNHNPIAAQGDFNAAYVDAAVEDELDRLAGTPKGSRNNQLNDSAFALGTFVGAGALSRADAERALASVYGQWDGLRLSQGTAKRGLDAGQQHPREVPLADDAFDWTPYLPTNLSRSRHSDPGNTDNPANDNQPKKRERFSVTWFDAIAPSKPKKTFIKGVFGEGEVTVLVGLPGTGKSVVATDMACHVAAGMSWHGRKVEQGLVIYFAAERKDLTERRMLAFRKRHKVQDVPLLVIGGRIDLTKNLDDARAVGQLINEAAEACGMRCVWVILDTLTRVFGAGDQNTSKDMGGFIQSVDEIAAMTKAHITVVHHTGWSGERGKGAIDLDGAVDASFIVKREGGNYVLICDGTNDGEIGKITQFRMEGVIVGEDEDGEPTEAPVVVPVEEGPPVKLTSGRQTNDLAMEALNTALEQHGVEPDGHHFPDEILVVTDEQWREAFFAAKEGNPESLRRAYNRAKIALTGAGKVVNVGQWFYIA